MVEVTLENGILTIHTPFTFKRAGNKSNDRANFVFMNYIRAALKQYQYLNKIRLSDYVEKPFVFVIKRITDNAGINALCDNDNVENGRIVNEVCKAIGSSDNFCCMDIYSCARFNNEKPQSRMYFFIIPKSKFNDSYIQ